MAGTRLAKKKKKTSVNAEGRGYKRTSLNELFDKINLKNKEEKK